MTKIMVIGATSAIARETALCFAAKGAAFFLVARNRNRLEAIAEELRKAGASKVEVTVMDVLEYDRHEGLATEASARIGPIDVAIIAHGTLPDQKACESSFDEARRELEVNALSVISLLTSLANYFVARKCGTLAVFSSVAADRGRQSNYVYCAAKSAVTVFLQGLRNRLHGTGVTVVTLKIGRVDTPMTVGFTKGALWARPDRVGAGIYKVIERKREVAYVPGYWRGVMMVIKAIPEVCFKRLRL